MRGAGDAGQGPWPPIGVGDGGLPPAPQMEPPTPRADGVARGRPRPGEAPPGRHLDSDGGVCFIGFTMRRVPRALLFIALAVAAPAGLHAASDVTLQVEVIDPAGYVKDGQHGPEFADRTYEAAEGGQTLALLDPATQTVYLLLAEEPGDDPNELVYDYANQLITVTGRVYERGGLKGLVVLSAQGPPAPAEADVAPDAVPPAE